MRFQPLCLAFLAALSIAVPSVLPTDSTPGPSAAPGTPGQPQDPSRGRVVRLRLGGHLEGSLEPCGCAGGQIGGLSRRISNLLLDRASYDVLLEAGNLVKGGTILDEYKLLTTTTIFGDSRRPHDAVGLGPDDLLLPLESLAPYIDFGVPFVGCDLVVEVAGDEDAEDRFPAFALRPYFDLDHDGQRIRVTGFVGTAGPANTDDAPESPYRSELLSPAAGWKRAMAGVDPEALRVVFVHHDHLIETVAALTPRPDLIVMGSPTHSDPPAEPTVVAGVPVVFPGTRGRHLLDVHLRRDEDGPEVVSYRPFPLDGSQHDEATEAAILQHRFDVAEDDLLQEMARTRPSPGGIAYVADETACAGCHQQEMEVWNGTKHAHAWKTLEDAEEGEKYGWPVTEYPDCVSCHSVGYGEATGFVDYEQTGTLASVRCQSCHGPAMQHLVSADKSKGFVTDARRSCQTCHDFEQSPGFDYSERWPQIQHGGR